MEISESKFGDLGTMSGVEGGVSDEVVLPAGKVVADRFEIVGVIGRGGMGTVYEVQDQMRDERAALKFLRPELVSSDTARQRFLNEAKIAISLSHPHIISVFDVVKYVNTCFLTMELLKGQSLRERLQELAKANQQMPLDEALRITMDVASALEYAHQSTIHRDIKPENIWILPNGRAKLMDFGIARLQDQTSNLTKTTSVLGTAYYMAPEQLVGAGQVDHRADQYSLGVVFYEMLTGKLPIGRHAPASDIRKDISKKVDAVIGTMMSGSATDRYPNDESLLSALGRLKRSGTKNGLPKAPAKAISIAAMVAIFAGGGYAGWQWLDERNKAEQMGLAEERVKAEELAKVEAGQVAEEQAKKTDEEGWANAKKANNLEGYKAYLSQYPVGIHKNEASKKIEELKLVQQVGNGATKQPKQSAQIITSQPVSQKYVPEEYRDAKGWLYYTCEIQPFCKMRVIWSQYEEYCSDGKLVTSVDKSYRAPNCPNGWVDGKIKLNTKSRPGLAWSDPSSRYTEFLNGTQKFHEISVYIDQRKQLWANGNSVSRICQKENTSDLCKQAANIFGEEIYH